MIIPLVVFRCSDNILDLCPILCQTTIVNLCVLHRQPKIFEASNFGRDADEETAAQRICNIIGPSTAKKPGATTFEQ